MTQPVSNTESQPEKKQLTDKTLVCILIAFEKPYTFFRQAGKTVFEFDETDITEILDAWKQSKKIPIDDVSKIFAAITRFNSAVRD